MFSIIAYNGDNSSEVQAWLQEVYKNDSRIKVNAGDNNSLVVYTPVLEDGTLLLRSNIRPHSVLSLSIDSFPVLEVR